MSIGLIMDVRLIGIVAIGGALGAVLRYSIPSLLPVNYGLSNTIIINLIGSLLLGILFGAISAGLDIGEETTLLIGTGILGAFTTMSTFALESIELLRENELMAVMYIFISVFGSIFLAFLGYSIMDNLVQ
jgi:CrcB protein